MNLTAIFRSSFTRVTALVAAVTTGVSLVAFIIAYASFAGVADRQVRQLVNTDLASLAELFSTAGVEATARSLEDRSVLRPLSGESPVYILAGPEGGVMAGDVAQWPQGLSADADWVDTEFVLEEGATPVTGRALLLPGGYRLFAGRTTTSVSEALARLQWIFAAGLAAAALLGVSGGAVAASLIRRKVARLNDTLHAVRRGGVDRRAPPDASGDEFSTLTGNVNAALDRIEHLIAAQREVGELTAHELKGPLAQIELELARAPRGESVAKARERLHDLLALIDTLMDLSKISAQIGDESGFETLDLADLVMRTAGLFEDVAEEAGVALVIEADTPAPMEGSPVQLGRLAANLIDNALKFTPRGGRVEVIVRPGPVLCVRDTGPGIPPAMRDAVFNRFVRAGSETARGYGLGLSFVHSVARRHGLTVQVGDAFPDRDPPGARVEIS